MGVQVPPAAPFNYDKKFFKNFPNFILFLCINHNYANEINFSDYPLSYIIDSCKITKAANYKEKEKEKILRK